MRPDVNVPRVLQVIGAMNLAGAETMLMNLYRNIDRTKIQFDFLVNAEKPSAYDSEIEGLGGQIYHLPRYRIVNILSYRAACKSMLSELAKTHPIVHGHIGAPAAIYLSEAKKCNCYTIAHSHNTNGPINLEEIAFRASSFPTRFVADYFFACSLQAGIDRFGKSITESTRFDVIPNGIDAASLMYSEGRRSYARELLGISDEVVVGHVGRFEDQKNHAFLLDAYAAFHKIVPNSKLVLIGTGTLKNQTEQRAESLGIAQSTLFLGNRTDMGDLYAAFDIFAFPSVMEGFGVALLEAQASGLPCIVSEAIQNEAIVSEDVYRIPLAAGAEVWAEQMCCMANTSTIRTAGVRHVQERGFDVHESARYLEQFYLEHLIKN